MDPSSSNKYMDQKSNPDPHNQQPLKCPRCDSSNTKFCYYNNYSLSQPRHFCKACKRYWTRGGTLRNVPVGGGCRKNKRVKRPTPSGDGVSSAVTSYVPAPPPIDQSPVWNHMSGSSFYSLPTNPLEANFPFSRLSPGFDFHRPNHIELGFSSGFLTGQDFNGPQDPVFLGSASSSGCASTMSSLLASIQQHKFVTSGLIMPYDHDMQGRDGNGISNEREVKMEGESNRLDQNNYNQVHHSQQINSSSDANSSLLWNTSNISSWFDPSNNMGSSVPSLI